MCGRFTLAARLEQLRERYEIQSVSQDYTPNYQPYNVAPTQHIPIIRMNAHTEPVKELITAKWGFNIGPNTVINSRDDKLEISKTYQQALQSTRCLIPANGFYEWKTSGKNKIPYYFRTTDQEIYSFAGFYQYMPAASEYRLGSSIITTKPNSLVESIHDRMPVILTKETEPLWLDENSTTSELLDCLVSYPAERMESYQVSRKVNAVKNSNPDMIRPKTTLQDFF